MPRGKRTDKSRKKDVIPGQIRRDHEEFLKAFEKPTQIYRFIRARQLISPTFLHRTALYMPERCSRTNGRRAHFKVDDIYTSMDSKGLFTTNTTSGDNAEALWIAILGFYDIPTSDKNKKNKKFYKRLDVEVAIKKSLYAKRKNSEIQHQITTQNVISVPVNPRTNFENSPSAYLHRKDGVVKIPYAMLSDKEDHFSSSYSIVIRIRDDRYEKDDSSSEELSDDEDYSDEENDSKRRKVEEEDDPAGISLKNLTSGPRKRKTRMRAADEEEDSDGEKRRPSRLRKEETSGLITHPVKEKMAYTKSFSENSLAKPLLYETEISCFDKEKSCKLTEGEYDIVMKQVKKEEDEIEYKRNAQWETFDDGQEIALYSALNEPSLKFHLMWIRRPKPDADQSEDEAEVDVVNDPPAKKSQLKDDSIEYRKSKLPRYRKKSQPDNKISETNGLNGASEGNNSVIQYQFMYNNNTQMQTEARVDLFCPWCQLNCFSRYGLMKHLTLCHPRFLFSYSHHMKGAKIIVNINQCYDGSFAGNPQNMFDQPGLTFAHRYPVRRIPNSDIIVYRPQRLPKLSSDLCEILEKENLDSISMTQYRAGHRRLYFHSLTSLPIKPCQFDYDSEGEGEEPEWLTIHMKQMIDEFTDVNEGEKAMMKMWNIFIMRNPCISDTEMETKCKGFLTTYLEQILNHNLKRNFLLHIVCLVDFGVLKASSIRNIMKFFTILEHEYKAKFKLVKFAKDKVLKTAEKQLHPADKQLHPADKQLHPGISPDFPEADMQNTVNKLKAIIASAKD